MAVGRKTGGRQKGTPNKATASLKGMAQQYTEIAVQALAEVVGNEESPAIARVKAAEALLDRGHGRPTQHIEAKISPLEQLTDDELAASIAALREAIGGSEGARG